jgi:hypothetical protein
MVTRFFEKRKGTQNTSAELSPNAGLEEVRAREKAKSSVKFLDRAWQSSGECLPDSRELFCDNVNLVLYDNITQEGYKIIGDDHVLCFFYS